MADIAGGGEWLMLQWHTTIERMKPRKQISLGVHSLKSRSLNKSGAQKTIMEKGGGVQRNLRALISVSPNGQRFGDLDSRLAPNQKLLPPSGGIKSEAEALYCISAVPPSGTMKQDNLVDWSGDSRLKVCH